MFLFSLWPLAALGMDGPPPPPSGSATNVLLSTWSFTDTTNWVTDTNHLTHVAYPPVSFTNLNVSDLGNGTALVLDSPDPAWLRYHVVENDGTTNLMVNHGSVMFWFAPYWSGTSAGGTGPGVWGRLLEIGSYTPDSSYGWWSLYVDDKGNNLYFSAQTNDFSSNLWTYLPRRFPGLPICGTWWRSPTRTITTTTAPAASRTTSIQPFLRQRSLC